MPRLQFGSGLCFFEYFLKENCFYGFVSGIKKSALSTPIGHCSICFAILYILVNFIIRVRFRYHFQFHISFVNYLGDMYEFCTPLFRFRYILNFKVTVKHMFSYIVINNSYSIYDVLFTVWNVLCTWLLNAVVLLKSNLRNKIQNVLPPTFDIPLSVYYGLSGLLNIPKALRL